MSAGISLKEMGVMLIVVIILLALVNKIPPLIAGIITRRERGRVPASASSVQALRWVPQAWQQQRPRPAAPPGRRRSLGRRWCLCRHGRLLEGQ
ncbi:hypothetical protein [Burkholderia plantarii]|uniref:hypothetical protein n=1 Tax=Burkholderia plantarii TaxID=41899 RepID=UPI0035565458